MSLSINSLALKDLCRVISGSEPPSVYYSDQCAMGCGGRVGFLGDKFFGVND